MGTTETIIVPPSTRSLEIAALLQEMISVLERKHRKEKERAAIITDLEEQQQVIRLLQDGLRREFAQSEMHRILNGR